MKDRIVTIKSNKLVAKNIYQMELQLEENFNVKCGQFIHLEVPDNTFVLRRPFCIADFDNYNKIITIFYQVVGKGTKALSKAETGTILKALIGLGNGFDLENYEKIMIVSGGMGTAVMTAVKTSYPDKKLYSFVGFNSLENSFGIKKLTKDSEQIYIATADGSKGYKGFITDVVKDEFENIKPDVVIACGPEPMFKSLNQVLKPYNVPVYISLERRMGCGIGACLVCNCKVKRNGEEKYLRACVDGPVFLASEVDLDG